MTTQQPGRPAERCAVASLRRGDPMPGTAAPAAGYVLVEQPGGWGRQALTSSRLDPDIGRALSARAIALGLRALLVRRPGRRPDPERRRWAVVSSRTGREVSWWGDFGADEELLTLPLDGSAGSPSYQPFFLVCTHGRHDTCCAVEGRPVAAALERRASRDRVGVLARRRGPVRGERPGDAARALLREGAPRGRRGPRGRPRPRRGAAAPAARAEHDGAARRRRRSRTRGPSSASCAWRRWRRPAPSTSAAGAGR